MKKWIIAFSVLFATLIVSTVCAVELPSENVKDIMLHEGKYVTVVGTVASTYIAKSGKVRFLNFAEDYRTAFTVVIFTGDLGKFTATIGEPTEYYRNKKVKVTGKVSIYRDKPQIIVNSPNQIKVVN